MKKFRRSPFFYVGDKYKILYQITKRFPETITRYIEPFTGGGSVFLNIQAEEYLLNDLDENLIGIHKFLIDNSKNKESFFSEVLSYSKEYGLSRSYIEDIVPIKLKAQFKKVYYSRYNKNGFERLKEKFNNSNIKDFFILYLLLIYGFNRMLRFNSLGEYNVPVGNVDFNKNVKEALVDYFDFVQNRKISLSTEDYGIFLSSLKFKEDDFVYLDPPYLISFSEYNKLWNKDRELELLQILDNIDKNHVKFAISNIVKYNGFENEIFREWMNKFKVYSIESNYISYHNNTKKNIKEVLVTNYE